MQQISENETRIDTDLAILFKRSDRLALDLQPYYASKIYSENLAYFLNCLSKR
jgi:hypothetical protein